MARGRIDCWTELDLGGVAEFVVLLLLFFLVRVCCCMVAVTCVNVLELLSCWLVWLDAFVWLPYSLRSTAHLTWFTAATAIPIPKASFLVVAKAGLRRFSRTQLDWSSAWFLGIGGICWDFARGFGGCSGWLRSSHHLLRLKTPP